MNGKKSTLVVITLFIFILTSGCMDVLQDLPTKYEANPTKIRYDIKYGYIVNCSGKGDYKIKYMFDLPEQIKTKSYNLLYNESFSLINTVNNSFVLWNISGRNDANFELGITASVESENDFVSDLNGENALSIEDIPKYFPEIDAKFTQEQANLNIILIDPNDSNINSIARTILIQSKSNNSFIVAK